MSPLFAALGRIEGPQDLKGLEHRVFILMGFKRQRTQKLRRKLADIAVMIIEEVEMAVGPSQRAGFLHSRLEGVARNVFDRWPGGGAHR